MISAKSPALAFSADPPPKTVLSNDSKELITRQQPPTSSTVAYKPLSLAVDSPFGMGTATVPVACWYLINKDNVPKYDEELIVSSSSPPALTYPHRISVKKIGQLLANWDWIPDLAARDFQLQPSSAVVVDGQALSLPTRGPVVFLAHGYLGSRFDLSHLAEALAAEGFICFSPEYPESLAASYNRMEGLDRSEITNQLLEAVEKNWNVHATSYGIVGHSLGCGTAIRTGDESWARVCIAGFPGGAAAQIPGSVLFVSSMNDGAVSLSRFGGKSAIPPDYVQLDEKELFVSTTAEPKELPSRAALIFDRPDAPNHISFLAEGVNDAMIDLLSPLLPVAQALSIPVLDFDRYQVSRDSQVTAEVMRPLVTRYLKQHMRMA